MRFDQRPFIAIWETTQACDLVCQHCRATARPERDPAELDTAQAKRLLARFAAAEVPLVILTGGDPAKRDDLLELVEFGAKAGLSLGLTPSATPLMTRSLLEKLHQAGLKRLAISIDGTSAATHDTFRGRPGSYVRSYEILRDARAVGLPTQVNTTMHAGNLDSLQTLAEQLVTLDIQLWSVFLMVPTGRAKLSLLPTAQEVETALGELFELSQRMPFAIKTTAGPEYRRVVLERKQRGAGDTVIGTRGKQAMWVNEGRGFLFVSHRGQIYPSGFLPVPCGNVHSDDPIQVYREHPTFLQLRDSNLLKGKCGACVYRHVCGGARARAYAMQGDWLASDPLCAYVPPEYDGPSEVFDLPARKRHLTLS